ncbi:Beta-galactosidase 7 [Citrus sinensis]|uniref:Beta-galactosidase 7 n=2 Tax=Citrus sinensis TaxID=2711 RepID=A0ACB8KEN4_CITSI|nr:Beta-galactosidase 7 [Citrus sinensis]
MSSSYWTEILLILNLSFVCLLSSATQVDYDANAIIINGERRVIFSGAIHYPRSTSQMWPDLIRKAKDGGLDAIETYIFWNAHEPQRHQIENEYGNIMGPYKEAGNLNQPKWGHLKQLHEAIKLGEKILTSGNVTTKQFGNGVNLTTYSNTTSGERFCFLSNTNTSQDANVDLQQDGKYFVPAWSVSILHGCNKEVYNTAKVNTETTVMVKKPIELGTKLSWMWAQETIRDTLHGKGRFNATKLIEQKEATSDESDYLWYMTSIENMGKSSHNATLYVKSSGQVLHAYVNSKHIGSQFGYDFEFKQPAILRPGKNFLTLLSATVGLQNYGEFFDLGPEGLAGGPVELNVDGMASLNLSSNIWNYKVGLNGEAKRLYDPNSPHAHIWKTSKKLPIGKPMKWYKTSFKIPPGTSPVVVDLQGMGKGHAWVNGNSLGRYWPSQIADTNGCSDTCDYRGEYKPEKCVTNCGNPSQRWYHVPRSFLNDGTNTLILFEEMGGNPSHVSFQTVVAAAV